MSLDDNETATIRRYSPGAPHIRQLSREQVAGLSWRTIGSNSRTRDVYDDRNALLDDILRGIDLGGEQDIFDAIDDSLRQALDISTVLGHLRAELATQLSRALPETIGSGDLAFVPGGRADAPALGDVRLQVTRGGQTRNLTEQSDGTRALFAIALYDLVAEAANIVAVDEPEIHLHPTSQRSLARLLQGGTNQKILATHSSDIVAAFGTDQVVAVKAGGQLVQPQAGLLSNDERMRVRWWTHNRLEPLTARKILAVEGLSDRILIEAAAEATGRDLDRLGVSVLATEGSGDMKAVIKLFGSAGFDIATALLIDNDAAPATAGYLGVSVADLPQHHVWVSQPDLEAEYVNALGPAVVWTALNSSGLFTSNELSTCATSGPSGTSTAADIIAFCCSNRRKVSAAMSVATVLTPGTVAAMATLSGVLIDACGS